jgi:hypothetical protein
MTYATSDMVDLEHMPRGGPAAGWLDRALQTDRLEYLDRGDVPEEVKQTVIGALQRIGERVGTHEKQSRFVVDLLGDSVAPKILELGAGHGELSGYPLAMHPGALISMLRMYSKSAFLELGRAADRRLSVQFLPISMRFAPLGAGAVIYSKPAGNA